MISAPSSHATQTEQESQIDIIMVLYMAGLKRLYYDISYKDKSEHQSFYNASYLSKQTVKDGMSTFLGANTVQ